MEVPTLASSETTISLSGTEKMGGSFTSFTVTLMDVVSLNGPTLKKLESMFLFVASILSEKLLLVSKSRGWKRQKRRRREGRFISDNGEVLMDGRVFSDRVTPYNPTCCFDIAAAALFKLKIKKEMLLDTSHFFFKVGDDNLSLLGYLFAPDNYKISMALMKKSVKSMLSCKVALKFMTKCHPGAN